MIYAINKRTKEHRVIGSALRLDEKIVEADADGWIEWDAKPGAGCPLPHDADCDVRHEDGFVAHRVPAHKEKWSGVHSMPRCRIVAYRPIIENDTPKPKERKASMPEQGADATTPRRPFLDSGRLRERFGPFEVSPPAWNGEGEIQAGMMVSWERYANPVRVKFAGEKFAIVESDFGQEGAVKLSLLRPIRSEEDRVIDDLVRIIADGHDVYIGAHEAAHRLYRAGYRKTGDE